VTFIQRYADSLAFAPEFGDGLSNHLPMALVAAEWLEERLGLAGRVEAFFAAYAPRLEPLATDGKTEAILGDYASLGAFDAAYSEQIHRRGSAAALTDALGVLGRAVPATAGHGLLRVYFAVEALALAPDLATRELARGLSYWAARYHILSDAERGSSSLSEVLSGLVPLAEADRIEMRQHRLITERQDAVSRSPIFRTAAASVDGASVDVLGVAARLAAVAVTRPDFTLLHALTTAQAILGLAAALPELDLGPLKQGWSDFVIAACLTENLPTQPTAPPGAATVDQLRALVAATVDDHAIKSAFSLLRLHDLSQDPVFLSAALALQQAFHQ